MPSRFNNLVRRRGAALLQQALGEKNAVRIVGNRGEGDITVDAIVGQLTSTRVEQEFEVVEQEKTTLQITRAQLSNVQIPLRDSQQIAVAAYPGSNFQVVTGESDYGDSLIKLTIAREPIVRFDERRRAQGA